MKFSIKREAVLRPLQMVQGVVERRQTLPILANVLLSVRDGRLAVTATDMEVEVVAYAALPGVVDGEITVPARKMTDICRALPPESDISFEVEGERAIIRCGRSRFTLTTLPASNYPNTDDVADAVGVAVEGAALKSLLELTQFAMAHQDVRYYLNGLLLEVGAQYVRAVATDGHRLALSELQVESKGMEESRQII
ncbi:MAG: DNA polymerase III subunit beta, partial [Candidatus Zixiibacteriota bacterium]